MIKRRLGIFIIIVIISLVTGCEDLYPKVSYIELLTAMAYVEAAHTQNIEMNQVISNGLTTEQISVGNGWVLLTDYNLSQITIEWENFDLKQFEDYLGPNPYAENPGTYDTISGSYIEASDNVTIIDVVLNGSGPVIAIHCIYRTSETIIFVNGHDMSDIWE